MQSVLGCLSAAALALCVCGCGDFADRLNGYPTHDTALNLETATPNQIADALLQMASISTLGDDWEFADPNDRCTVQILSAQPEHNYTLDLRGARFSLHRDASTQRYYATLRHGSQDVLDRQQRPLRLFEAETYHDVFFAEGYLQALSHKCARSTGLTTAAASLR